MSFTVASRENVRHIFQHLGEPKTLKTLLTQLIAACAAVQRATNIMSFRVRLIRLTVLFVLRPKVPPRIASG